MCWCYPRKDKTQISLSELCCIIGKKRAKKAMCWSADLQCAGVLTCREQRDMMYMTGNASGSLFLLCFKKKRKKKKAHSLQELILLLPAKQWACFLDEWNCYGRMWNWIPSVKHRWVNHSVNVHFKLWWTFSSYATVCICTEEGS